MKLYEVASVRTNNFSENVESQIGQLWNQVITKLDKIPEVMYGVYHDYESDYRGDYTLTVATEKRSEKRTIDVPDGKYKLFPVDITSETGVIEAWQKVWKLELENQLQRVYKYDYEKYDLDGSITLYIGIQ